jgi:hypothetical protein
MGSEMVTLYVGQKQEPFSVHKNLICSTGKFFDEFLNVSRPAGQRIVLAAETPAVFKLFIEYLYTKSIPCVRQHINRLAQAQRLKDLCQLYAFADRFKLENIIRNKIMDSIQDGFCIMSKLPEGGLVKAIYEHTQVGSKLREFSTHSLVYNLRSADYISDGSLGTLLKENEDIMDDFLSAVQALEVPDRDPRIRDCRGEEGCAECAGHPDRMQSLVGVWPCAFHIHRVTQGKSDGNTEESEVVDKGCYLWT